MTQNTPPNEPKLNFSAFDLVQRNALSDDVANVLKKFASDNSLAFNVIESSTDSPSGSSVILDAVGFARGFTLARCRTGKRVVVDQRVKPAVYSVIGPLSGSDDLSEVIRYDVLIRAKLLRKTPHILIVRKDQQIKKLTNMKRQSIKLEGNFNDIFAIYLSPNYQIDALQILTPDVMDALMRQGSNFSYELIDNDLYIYARLNAISSSLNVAEFFANACEIAREFNEQIVHYSDARVANRRADKVDATGRRIAKKYRKLSDVAGTILLGCFLACAIWVILQGEQSPLAIVIEIIDFTSLGLLILYMLIKSLVEKFVGDKEEE
jgi:hypothetical protein